MESNPRKKVLENEVGVDRISNLPDPILGKILSYLHTKDAVATSILSKRWKNLPPFAVLPIKLYLVDSLEENESNPPSVSFADFVDKLLNVTLSDVPYLESVFLICNSNYGDAKIMSWICAVVRLNVRRLSLWLTLKESDAFFAGLHGCTTLARLTLSLHSELCLPDDLCLPNLESLELYELTLNNEEDGNFVNDLIKGCPALEDLCLSHCNLKDSSHLWIESRRLKSLKMEGCLVDSFCELMIYTPKLEALTLNDYVAWDYTVPKIKSLQVAHINVGASSKQVDEDHDNDFYDDDGAWQFDNAVARLVTACSKTISLYLASCSISALCNSRLKLPNFRNLTWLSLGRIGLDDWALLARLLLNAPKLGKLTIEEGFAENEEGFANFQKSLPVVPVCLELHMKTIEIWVFKGDENEIRLVEYFLKNGVILQKLLLFCLPADDGVLTRLLMLPRKSQTCQIVCRPK